MRASSCCQLRSIHVAVHPRCTVGHQGPQGTGGGMENALLEYKVGQTEAEENSSFSSALLILTVTALNVPKEDQGVLQSCLLLACLLNVLIWRVVGVTSTCMVMKQSMLSAAAW